MAKGDPKARLRELAEALPTMDFSSDAAIEEGIKALAAKNGLGFGDYQAVARLARVGHQRRARASPACFACWDASECWRDCSVCWRQFEREAGSGMKLSG